MTILLIISVIGIIAQLCLSIYYKKQSEKYKGKYEYYYDEYWKCIDAVYKMPMDKAIGEIKFNHENIPF